LSSLFSQQRRERHQPWAKKAAVKETALKKAAAKKTQRKTAKASEAAATATA
jgi:hypothetical protein